MSYEDVKQDKGFWILILLLATLGPVLYTAVGFIIFIHTGHTWVLFATAVMLVLLWYAVYQLFQLGLITVEINRIEKELRDSMNSGDLISERKRFLEAIRFQTDWRFSLLQRNDFDFSKFDDYERDIYKLAGDLIDLNEESLMENTRRLCNENHD